jgi:hypothetical protein
VTSISSTISSMLGLATNGVLWVLLGLGIWVLAHLQLYILGPKVLGCVVTLVLAIIPVWIIVVLGFMFVQKLFGKHWWQAGGLFVLALLSVVYIFLGGVKDGKVSDGEEAKKKSDVKKKIETLIKFEVFKSEPTDTFGKVMLLLGGAISVLIVVALGLSAGWQLIQGSEAWGVGLAFGCVLLVAACHWPQRKWNLAAKAYSALEKISTGAARVR